MANMSKKNIYIFEFAFIFKFDVFEDTDIVIEQYDDEISFCVIERVYKKRNNQNYHNSKTDIIITERRKKYKRNIYIYGSITTMIYIYNFV